MLAVNKIHYLEDCCTLLNNSKKVQEGDATKADSSSTAWTKKLIELWLN